MFPVPTIFHPADSPTLRTAQVVLRGAEVWVRNLSSGEEILIASGSDNADTLAIAERVWNVLYYLAN